MPSARTSRPPGWGIGDLPLAPRPAPTPSLPRRIPRLLPLALTLAFLGLSRPGEAFRFSAASCDLPGGSSGGLALTLADETPRLFYGDGEGKVRVLRKTAEGWSPDPPMPDGESQGPLAPAWDRERRRLLLAFHDRRDRRLRLLVREGDGTWRVVFRPPETGRGARSLVLGVAPGGTLYLLGNDNVREGEEYPFCHRAPAPEGPWQEGKLLLRTPDGQAKPPRGRGRYLALAFDEEGNAHGAFSQGATALSYGTTLSPGGAWAPFRVTQGTSAAHHPSLAVSGISPDQKVRAFYRDGNRKALVREEREETAWGFREVASCDSAAGPRLAAAEAGDAVLFATRQGSGEAVRLALWGKEGNRHRLRTLGFAAEPLTEEALFLARRGKGLLGGWCSGGRLHWFEERVFPERRPEAGLALLDVPEDGWPRGLGEHPLLAGVVSPDLLGGRDVETLDVWAVSRDSLSSPPGAGRFLEGTGLRCGMEAQEGTGALPLVLEFRVPLDPALGTPRGADAASLRAFLRENLCPAKVLSGEPVFLLPLLPDGTDETLGRFFDLERDVSSDALIVGIRVLLADGPRPEGPVLPLVHRGKGVFAVFDGCRDGILQDPWAFFGRADEVPHSPTPFLPSETPSPSPALSPFLTPLVVPTPCPSLLPVSPSPTGGSEAGRSPGGCDAGGFGGGGLVVLETSLFCLSCLRGGARFYSIPSQNTRNTRRKPA